MKRVTQSCISFAGNRDPVYAFSGRIFLKGLGQKASETIKGFTFTIFFLLREGSRGGGGILSEEEATECPRSAIPSTILFSSPCRRPTDRPPPPQFNPLSASVRNTRRYTQGGRKLYSAPRCQPERGLAHSSGPLDATRCKWRAT